MLLLEGENSSPSTTTAAKLLKSQRFHGKIGDRHSYWLNRAVAIPEAFFGFEIPVTTKVQLLSGFNRESSKNNVLVYSEPQSVLLIPDELKEVKFAIPATSVPSVVIRCQHVFGKSVRVTDTNLREVLSNAE